MAYRPVPNFWFSGIILILVGLHHCIALATDSLCSNGCQLKITLSEFDSCHCQPLFNATAGTCSQGCQTVKCECQKFFVSSCNLYCDRVWVPRYGLQCHCSKQWGVEVEIPAPIVPSTVAPTTKTSNVSQTPENEIPVLDRNLLKNDDSAIGLILGCVIGVVCPLIVILIMLYCRFSQQSCWNRKNTRQMAPRAIFPIGHDGRLLVNPRYVNQPSSGIVTPPPSYDETMSNTTPNSTALLISPPPYSVSDTAAADCLVTTTTHESQF